MWQLYKQGAGGIVGDEMGLGKTVQVCGALLNLAISVFLNAKILTPLGAVHVLTHH